ncbi:MAG: DUF4465 domain-containing protein, partial [Lentimicrobiaceae bacterium]|nr:DUF4465 domain-containing protein [Lentimicrobiaceae bacterium]
IEGTGYVALPQQRGAIIRNNTLIDQYTKHIYILSEQDALIENNIINNANSGKNNGHWSIDLFRCKGGLIIRNNKITLTQNAYTSGIYLRNETAGTTTNPALVYNNSISITNSPNTSTYAIYLSTDCSNIAFYYNSINVSGTNGRCFGTNGTAVGAIDNITFQNNLFQNNTTGGGAIYFFGNTSHYQKSTFKNNAYYNTGNFTNTIADFADWTTASEEQNSFVEQAQFITSSDLHLMEAGGLKAALPVSFITKDADENFRSLTTPTIGAFEYEPIVIVQPEVEEGYPKTGSITYNSIEFKTKWNQSGNLYGIIKKASEEAPTKPELLEATVVNLNSGVEYISKFIALDEETNYKAYFIFVSVFNVESDIVASDIAKTLKQIYPLQVTLPEIWATVSAGTEVKLYPIVSGSVYPYTYEWRNKMNEIISTDSILTVTLTTAQQYKLTVTGSDSQSKALYTDVLVRGESAIATFEDNYLSSESFWQGRNAEQTTKFYSGSYSFTNTDFGFYWGGFAYSNLTATEFDPNQSSTHQFRSVVGHGAEESSIYAVMYDMDGYYPTKIEVIHSEAATTISGVYLTNAAYTYNSMVNGDYLETPFKQGDYYKVIFKGNTGTTVEYYLADYRSSNEAEHYILTDWKWFDLSVLGNITSVTISVDGSRKNAYGLTTPAYLCMDNFGATEPVVTPDYPTTPTNLAGVPSETTIALSWTASTSNVAIAGYNIYVDGTFVKIVTETNYTITELLANTEYYIEVEAFNEVGNKSEKASISVRTLTVGITDVTESTFTVYPNPFADYIMVRADVGSHISVYNISGQCLLNTTAESGEIRIETVNFPTGVYILKCGERVVKLVK